MNLTQVKPTKLSYPPTMVVFIIIMMVGQVVGISQSLRELGERIFQPLVKLNVGIAEELTLPFRAAHQSLRNYEYVQDLELRYAETVAQLAEIDALKKENDELKKQLNPQQVDQKISADSGVGQRFILPIIAYGQPTISFTANDQVQEGMPVLYAQTLLGRIGKITQNQAQVALLSERGADPVLVRTESGVTGVIVGDGRKVVMAEIPIEVDVRVGERVVTVGQSLIAQGLSVGRVQSIEKTQGAPTQAAVIDQVVSFYDAQSVEVRK